MQPRGEEPRCHALDFALAATRHALAHLSFLWMVLLDDEQRDRCLARLNERHRQHPEEWHADDLAAVLACARAGA
jgi:hypothetical protein